MKIKIEIDMEVADDAEARCVCRGIEKYIGRYHKGKAYQLNRYTAANS